MFSARHLDCLLFPSLYFRGDEFDFLFVTVLLRFLLLWNVSSCLFFSSSFLLSDGGSTKTRQISACVFRPVFCVVLFVCQI